MPDLERLRPDHAGAVLAFEVANRAYFMLTISDRGDAYFDEFDERFAELLADQAAGNGAYHVLIENGAVLGRFNLIFHEGNIGELGFRVAEKIAGQGITTATVREVCELAARRHRLSALIAAASTANIGSQRVLTKAGFVLTGPADPAHIGGKQGSWYRKDLTS